MELVDKKLLASVRAEAWCIWHRRASIVDAHHVMTKGAGRVDIPGNVVPLCRICHSESHDGWPSADELMLMAAARESRRLGFSVGQDAIRETVWLIRRLPKGTTSFESYLAELDGEARRYARGCLEAWCKRRKAG